MAQKKYRLASLLIAAAFLLGCQLNRVLVPVLVPGGIPASGQAPVPVRVTVSATIAPISTAGPQLILSAKTLHEAVDTPKATLDARWPVLEWGSDPRVNNFNRAAEDFVYGEFDIFRQGLAEMPDEPAFRDTSSSLHIDFSPTANSNGILSELFLSEYYNAGAAHPAHYSYAINYDLRSGKILALSDLFLPNSAYLEALSAACIADLESRQRLEWKEGALPTPENFQVWNITPDGLLITFDEYQVASYAAGPQTVLIPYDKLKSLLRPGGPLDGFINP